MYLLWFFDYEDRIQDGLSSHVKATIQYYYHFT